MKIIDLRSDTVTKPTHTMREAMANAPVGDDVKREDPTVTQLEELAAQMLGKEAGLFVTSGTQGNLTALLTHCGRGNEVIVGEDNHIFQWEVAGAAALGGLQLRTVPVNADGTYNFQDVHSAVRGQNVHYPDTTLICLENTHGGRGGVPVTVEYTQQIRELADHYGLKVHVDGARIWNAAAALNVDIKDLVAPVDTVTFCLSKGLAAPVGSVLVGSKDFIEQARRTRKMLGGGMRQAGVIAAAGVVALEEMTTRLHEDHKRAAHLGASLSSIEGITLDHPVTSNMVFFSIADGMPFDRDTLYFELAENEGIKVDMGYARGFRAVIHYEITDEDIQHVIDVFEHVMAVPV